MRPKPLLLMLIFGLSLQAQDQGPIGTPLKLVASEAMAEMQLPKAAAPKDPASADSGIRSSVLKLKPTGDPLYLYEETTVNDEGDKWRTYQRPKVDRFSKSAEGVALKGYDVLSYLERRAEKGSKEFATEYGGIQWYFTSREHLEQFQRSPESFLPQYGGFCAYSIGRGYPATADPRAFAVEDQKLYLFFDKAVQVVWEQDRQRMTAAANRYWPKLHRP